MCIMYTTYCNKCLSIYLSIYTPSGIYYSSGNVRDKRGPWMLVTTATVSRCKDHHLVDHMTPKMLLKRNVAPHVKHR